MFGLIVGLPLIAIVGLGWRSARDERERARRRLHDLLLVRLQDTTRSLDDSIRRLERRLQVVLESPVDDHDAIRRLIRQGPHVGQFFVLNPDGTLFHPDPGDTNSAERRFLNDYADVLSDRELLRARNEGDRQAVPRQGWIACFHGPGLQLFYGQRSPDGRVIGVHVPRARWMADLIADLPETTAASSSREIGPMKTRIRMVDSNGDTIYEWGELDLPKKAAPFQELALSAPLSSWRLQHFVDDRTLASFGRASSINVLTILAAAGLVLVGGGAWVLREYNRNYRESMQRVSFVNQVSHELKTPLTNIRMYAELLESDLEESAGAPATPVHDHLKVIVEESCRLSRLIGNVLTFGQGQRQALTLHPRTAVVDDVIANVVQHFSPALNRKGIVASFRPSGAGPVFVDVDALEQILGNLLSNVEKYAASGRRVYLTCSMSGHETLIEVCDLGPGIPPSQLRRIFRPFHRISDRISDSPGTGIGLTISQQLARLHGGDLRAVASESGARFELRIHTPHFTESEAAS